MRPPIHHGPKLLFLPGAHVTRNMSIHFVFVYMLNPAAIEATCQLVEQAEQDGALKHRVAGTYPLAQLAQAHQFAERDSGTGHVVMTIN